MAGDAFRNSKSKMYDRTLLTHPEVCMFRFVETNKVLRNLSIPKTAGCIVMARTIGHHNTDQVKKQCPPDAVVIPGAYDTNVINRVLLKLLAERPVERPEPMVISTEPQEVRKEEQKTEATPGATPPARTDVDTNATILLALYSEMPTRAAGEAWISDKKTGKAIRGICGSDADTRGIVATFIKKGWLLPRKRTDATRVGSYGATEAGLEFLGSQGEKALDLWCPVPPPTEAATSGLGGKIADLEREIEAAAGLDDELKAAEAKVDELNVQIKDRDEKKERLKQIKALLDPEEEEKD